MRNLESLGDLRGQRVLVRVDFNVPLGVLPDGITRTITDDARIRAALPTLKWLREQGARLVLAAHLGRPQGVDAGLSLAPVAVRLGELLGTQVAMAPSVVGERVRVMSDGLRDGELLMLENVRFEAGETKNDPELARAYAALADAYVDDAFGAAHRAHASNVGVAELIERRAAGRLLEREVSVLGGILAEPVRPLVAVVGGSKVTDKIGVIDAFLDRADEILIGGAMAFPFFRAQGHEVGSSLCEDAGVPVAAEALARAEGARATLRLPTDLVIAQAFSAEAEHRPLVGRDVPSGWMGLDIGRETAGAYADVIAGAGTVFWNGPMGAFELEPYAAGTLEVAEAVAAAPGTTVVGGGDSAAAMAQFGLDHRVDHLSTGGGASLELIEGRTLPGVEVLR